MAAAGLAGAAGSEAVEDLATVVAQVADRLLVSAKSRAPIFRRAPLPVHDVGHRVVGRLRVADRGTCGIGTRDKVATHP